MTTIPLIGFEPIGYAENGNVVLVTFIAQPGGEQIKFSMPIAMFEALLGQGKPVLSMAESVRSGTPVGEEINIELQAHNVDVVYQKSKPDTMLRVRMPPPDVTSYYFVVGPELTKFLKGSLERRLEALPQEHKTPEPGKRN